MTKNKQIIVKAQLSQFSSTNQRMMLIYDESREFEYEAPASKDIVKLMGDQPKAFFHAELVPNGNGKFEFLIKEKAEWQEW